MADEKEDVSKFNDELLEYWVNFDAYDYIEGLSVSEPKDGVNERLREVHDLFEEHQKSRGRN